jgi:hypothetical protein
VAEGTPQAKATGAEPTAKRPSISSVVSELRMRFSIVVSADSASLSKVRMPIRPLFAAVAIIAVAFALIRPDMTTAYRIPGHPLFTYVYTESLIFVVIALIAGVLSRTTGLIFLASFIVADFLQFLLVLPAPPRYSPNATTAVGRLITYWLLYILVLAIPKLERSFRAWLIRRSPRLWTIPAAVLGAALVAGLVLGWANVMPYLVRPAFNNRAPFADAIMPLQLQPQLDLALGAVPTFVLALLIRRRLVLADTIDLVPWRAWVGRLLPVATVIGYAVVILLLIGIITNWTDAVIILAGLVAGDVSAWLVGRTPVLRNLFDRVPVLARVILGTIAVLALAIAFMNSLFNAGGVYVGIAGTTDFFPAVVIAGVGLFVFRVILGPPRTRRAGLPGPPLRPSQAAAIGTMLFGLLTVGALALPAPVFAHDCSGFIDCITTGGAYLALALSALAAFIWAWLKGVFIPDPIGAVEPLTDPEVFDNTLSIYQQLVAQKELERTGDTDEYDRIRNLSREDFIQEAMTGKWDYVGTLGSSFGGGGGISGSAGCLAQGTRIDTPHGQRRVEDIVMGDAVWTADNFGARIAGRVVAVGRTRVPARHRMVHVFLSDDRETRVSPLHPLADGRHAGVLGRHDVVDGADVLAATLEDYDELFTFDLLASGPTGCYWADGVPMASTLKPRRNLRSSAAPSVPAA